MLIKDVHEEIVRSDDVKCSDVKCFEDLMIDPRICEKLKTPKQNRTDARSSQIDSAAYVWNR